MLQKLHQVTGKKVRENKNCKEEAFGRVWGRFPSLVSCFAARLKPLPGPCLLSSLKGHAGKGWVHRRG